MHKSRMIQKLKELKIAFISVYPHTEKVKLLDGSIRRLRDLEPNTEMTPEEIEEVKKALEEIQEVTFEVIEVIDMKPVDSQAETEKDNQKEPKET